MGFAPAPAADLARAGAPAFALGGVQFLKSTASTPRAERVRLAGRPKALAVGDGLAEPLRAAPEVISLSGSARVDDTSSSARPEALALAAATAHGELALETYHRLVASLGANSSALVV